jgi:hypothetical protein
MKLSIKSGESLIECIQFSSHRYVDFFLKSNGGITFQQAPVFSVFLL